MGDASTVDFRGAYIVGGPLVRDRFHYFGSFEGLREDGDPLPEPTVAAASFVPAA